MIHELKCEQQYFEAVASGKKTFEVRCNDRNFKPGDFLALNEVVVTANSSAGNVVIASTTEYTGRCCLVEVVYILEDKANRFLQPGYVCMAIRPCSICKTTDWLKQDHKRDVLEVPTYKTDPPIGKKAERSVDQ